MIPCGEAYDIQLFLYFVPNADCSNKKEVAGIMPIVLYASLACYSLIAE